MPNDSKTYILDDQWTDKDALDFTPYVETLADIIQTGNTPLTMGVFGTWVQAKLTERIVRYLCRIGGLRYKTILS